MGEGSEILVTQQLLISRSGCIKDNYLVLIPLRCLKPETKTSRSQSQNKGWSLILDCGGLVHLFHAVTNSLAIKYSVHPTQRAQESKRSLYSSVFA